MDDQQNQEIGTAPVMKRYVLCHTKAVGWQGRGYVIWPAAH